LARFASEGWWARQDNQTVMSGRVSISLVHFTLFSFDFDRFRCALSRLFLVRNWCGGSDFGKTITADA
jgi:hypothetical protein